MDVIPIQERARYRVTSESDEEPYLVDLLEYRRNGWCDCKNFRVTIQPKLETGKVPDVRWCKHIVRVREFLCECVSRLTGIADVNLLQRAVDRIVFRWQREEVVSQFHPRRYGTRSEN